MFICFAGRNRRCSFLGRLCFGFYIRVVAGKKEGKGARKLQEAGRIFLQPVSAFKNNAQKGLVRAYCLVQIDLPVHKVAAEEITFNGFASLWIDGTAELAFVIWNGTDRIDDAVDIEKAVFRAGVERVALQVVHAVDIELAGQKLMEYRLWIGSSHNGGDAFNIEAVFFKDWSQTLADYGASQFFVVNLRKRVLQSVGERAVAYIVQKGGRFGGKHLFGRELHQAVFAPIGQDALHEPHRSYRMLETGMFGPVEHAEAHSQLAYAAQALEWGRVYQIHQQRMADGDIPIDGIAQNLLFKLFLRQFLSGRPSDNMVCGRRTPS